MKILQLWLMLILVAEVMEIESTFAEANQRDFIGSPRTGSLGVNYIIRGHNATKGQFPYHAYLQIDKRNICGGSLIAPNWVLSAAHCAGRKVLVILGAININVPEEGRVEMQAKRVIPHNSYNEITVQNDIMLVELESSVELTSTVNIVTLASNNRNYFIGTTVRVCGFGRTSDKGKPSPVLKYADLTVISNSECQKAYVFEIYKSQICTKDLTDVVETQCSGDSGGPLVDLDTGVQIGIVSFSHAKGCENKKPKGNTRVSSFIDWIRKTTGLNL